MTTTIRNYIIGVAGAFAILFMAILLVTTYQQNKAQESFVQTIQSLNSTVMKSVQGVTDKIPQSKPEALRGNVNTMPFTSRGKLSFVEITTTNLTDKSLWECVQGTLVKKSAPSVQLKSLPLCITLSPHETRSVQAEWVGGNADDICTLGVGLNWSSCDFEVNRLP